VGVRLRPAAFLDRDGVVSHARVEEGRPYAPRSPDELVVIPGVAEACAALRDAGLAVVVVTNQPEVARGTLDGADLDAMHARLSRDLAIDEVVVCPHDDADECACRKPRPGMLLDAAERLALDLSRSVMVGDRWRDVEAGRRAGCATVFVDHGYDERRPDAPDLTVPDLAAGVAWIVRRVGLPCAPIEDGDDV